MNKIEDIRKMIEVEINEAASNFNVSELHKLQAIINWIEHNEGEDIEGLKSKIEAIQAIMQDESFLEAIQLNQNANELIKTGKQQEAEEVAEQAAEIIREYKQSLEYHKRSEESGYQILEKYESRDTHLRVLLSEYADYTIEMCKYIQDKIQQLKNKSSQDFSELADSESKGRTE